MEEETAGSAGQPHSNSLDPTLHKKHQAMLDRLSNRHQSRTKSAAAATTTTSADAAVSFSSTFSDSKHSIESQLADSSKIAAVADDPSRLRSHLTDISSSISSLEQLVAESSYFLPSYELRSSLKSVAQLKQSLENLNSELLPKKRFSFRNKSTTGKPSLPEPQEPEIPKTEILKPTLAVRDSPGFRNKENQILTKNFRVLEMGEYTLSDLDSCEVRLIGCINALFVHRLRSCKVFAGSVMGSILIEDVENCVFVLASHQIRIHYAKGSDFYLRVRSRPIIEDCGGVKFAPYCLKYEGLEEDLREAGLEEESGNWAKVDDFKWLRAVQSPNWSVLEESKRVGNIEIKDLGSGNCESYGVENEESAVQVL